LARDDPRMLLPVALSQSAPTWSEEALGAGA
jgi:hypothetical protein